MVLPAVGTGGTDSGTGLNSEAEIAQLGVPAVGVATRPFSLRVLRKQNADLSIMTTRRQVDTLITIPATTNRQLIAVRHSRKPSRLPMMFYVRVCRVSRTYY